MLSALYSCTVLKIWINFCAKHDVLYHPADIVTKNSVFALLKLLYG
jgi:hypothetical protein